jgi:integrase
MSSVLWKNGCWYARLKGHKTPGKWAAYPTDYKQPDQRDAAERYAKAAQDAIDKRNGKTSPNALTFRDWMKSWLEKRREAGKDWKKERGRLMNHVLPEFGGMALPDITTARIGDLVHDLRFKKKLANRTVRNVYGTLAVCLKAAAKAGKIAASPCALDTEDLGPIVDKDPEWRAGAQFTRKEAEAMIGDRRIPLDRQLVYAFGLLAGMRPGEAAALRWRNYDATRTPLGMLTAARGYSTSLSVVKGTKTNAVKFIPVHPVLAQMLAEWRAASKWGTEPDDLIVPLPPEVKRVTRTGDRYRGWDYTGHRWRTIDLPALGWRARSVYDTRATFITLALEDGADRDIIRDRVTHVPSKRDAFSGYDRGERWAETCREVGRLRLTRLVPAVYPGKSSSGKGLRRRVSNGRSEPPKLTVIQGGRGVVVCSCHPKRAILGTRVQAHRLHHREGG